MTQSEPIKVILEPHVIEQRQGNLTVTKSLNQDKVIIEQGGRRRHWGYVPTVSGHHGFFMPLSGFPKEYLSEVQRQINKLRGFADGDGPPAPIVVDPGPTSEEQLSEEESEDEDEFA